MKIKPSTAIAALLLAVLLAASIGDFSTVAAQGGSSTPGKPEVAPGERDGEVVVSWEAVEQANYYVIAWLARSDYDAAVAADRNWRESIVYLNIANNGQTSHTVTRLDPTAEYWFALGSRSGRYSKPRWSPWSNLVRPGGGAAACAGDRAALEALYNATNGAHWGNSDNWLSDAPLDDWFGVSAGGDGCVQVIDMYGNLLFGELPPELGNLSKLEALNLEANFLSGEIPVALGNLTRLNRLTLDHNILLSGTIPTEFGRLANLTHLSLWNNRLTGNIPAELGNLSNLTYLDLTRNDLTGTIPSELGRLTKLRTLWIGENRLHGEIPTELVNLSRLTWLGLFSNELTGEYRSSWAGSPT